MSDFTENLRKMYEAAYRCEGYEDVKAIVVDRDADSSTDLKMRECEELGYRFVDDKLFGSGSECTGKIVIYVR